MISLKKTINQLNNMQTIALGFAVIILAGACLLTLPVSSRDGSWTGFADALFTATSATCVTGLVTLDTWTHWNLFGQLLILLMIQVGGLGFITIGVLLSMMLHKKIGLRQRGMVSESMNAIQMGGVVGFVKRVLIGTAAVEGIGALLLSVRFCQELGFFRGVYYGIFHSISAFCNAGFDLMGYQAPFNSLVNYSGDWLVNLTLVGLIVTGGIGFLVWDDLLKNRWHFSRYRLHTKIVLVTTAVLIVGGTILFYLFERDNLMKDMGAGEAFLCSLFASVTTRTAGFNTTDIGAASEASKLLNVILMYIGGSPGSTAGGIKTTTIVIFLLYMRSMFQKTKNISICKRSLEPDAIKRATAIAGTNMFLALTAALILCGIQSLPLEDVLIETFSAISTVGMSAGITREFHLISKVVVMILMFCGRVGTLSVALSFTERRKASPIEYPEEKILIG
ncbi:MAG: TrkH family potassium uptake protein [Candidatus Limivivens sp.]|nr:TrkH family potassium uptake protein [Candidatus Limivivens sp.]